MSDAELDEAIASLRSVIDSAEATLAKLIAPFAVPGLSPTEGTRH